MSSSVPVTSAGDGSRDICLGIVRGISYGLFAPPDPFQPQVRDLGATLVRVSLTWAQVEPRPGELDWSVVDAVRDQVGDGDRLWVTVCSSSAWATIVPTDFLPPSPAKDDAAYARFIAALVERFGGAVGYWQCNNEPSNTGLLWAGTADEYVHQLRIFSDVVRRCDPAAQVVLGGCGYDVWSSPPDSAPRAFFEILVRDGADAFDLFSVHLYDDPSLVPEHIESARSMMRAHGFEKPVAVGEYNGPTMFEFPAAMRALEQAMLAAFAEPTSGGGLVAEGRPVEMSTGDLADQLVHEPPDRRALRLLHARADEQPPELRMFMHGPPAELEALRQRVGCRQLVQRAVLALASGVDLLTCWNLAPEIAGYTDPYNVMDLMFGTLALMAYDDRHQLTVVRPSGRTHRLLADVLHGVVTVDQVQTDAADVLAFGLACADGSTRLVAWYRGDDPLDESVPAQTVQLPWARRTASVTDVFGGRGCAVRETGRIALELTGTPVFVTERPLPDQIDG